MFDPTFPGKKWFLLAQVLLGACFFLSYASDAKAASTVVFLTSTSTSLTWTVPNDWNSAANTIEAIGGGSGGSSALPSGGGSGGGGAYAKISNLALTVGNAINYQVGSGTPGAPGNGGVQYSTNAGDSWFNGSGFVCSGQSICAKGGIGTTAAGGNNGGTTTTSIGTILNHGGAGANTSGAPAAAGGAGGPNGPGGDGSPGCCDATTPGAGGGGAGGGGSGTGGFTGGFNAASTGGTGGNNSANTGGGAGSASSASPGSNGTSGGGGGGGYSNGSTLYTRGGLGGNGSDWTQTSNSAVAGAGGGGGSPGYAASVASQTLAQLMGSNGGNYGGGGSQATTDSVFLDGPGGNGADGVIVITYVPIAAAGSPGGKRLQIFNGFSLKLYNGRIKIR